MGSIIKRGVALVFLLDLQGFIGKVLSNDVMMMFCFSFDVICYPFSTAGWRKIGLQPLPPPLAIGTHVSMKHEVFW